MMELALDVRHRMSVLGKLASALGRNDERPNVELAEALVVKPDKAAIAELAAALSNGTVAQQNDAIKVLYEIGERNPTWLPRTPRRSLRCSKQRTIATSGARCRRSTRSPR